MKLPIKKKYFDQIKNGEKVFDYRDAHITFICEETGETLRRNVLSVDMVDRPEKYKEVLKDSAIYNMNEDSFKAALDPKVKGSYVLAKLL